MRISKRWLLVSIILSLIIFGVVAVYFLAIRARNRWPKTPFFVVARIESIEFSDDTTSAMTSQLKRAVFVVADSSAPVEPFFYRRVAGRQEIYSIIDEHNPLIFWWIWVSEDSIRLIGYEGAALKNDTLLLPDTIELAMRGEFDALSLANAIVGASYLLGYVSGHGKELLELAIPRLENVVLDFDGRDIWLLLGWAYMADGKYSHARNVFLRADTSDYRVSYALGMSFLRDNRVDSAMAVFQSTISKAPLGCAMPLFGYGESLIKLEMPSEAVPPLRTGLKAMPNYARGNFLMGLAFDLNRQVDSAVAYYRKAARFDTTWAAPLYNLAILMGSRGDTAAALELYREVVRIDSLAFDAMTNMAWLYLQSGQLDSSIKWFKKLVERDTLSTDALYGLATAYFRKNEVEKADSVLRECIRISPEFLPAYLARVRMALKIGDMEMAFDAAHETVDSLPDEALAYNALASVYIASGDYRSGVRLLKQALELNPSEFDILANLGLAYHLLDDLQEAEKYYRKAAETAASSDVYINLASLYIEMKKPSKALDALSKAESENADDAKIYYLRGIAYYMLGNKGMARLNFVKCENKSDDVQLKTMAHRHLVNLSEYGTL